MSRGYRKSPGQAAIGPISVPGEGMGYGKSWKQARVLVWVWGLPCTKTALVGQLKCLDYAFLCNKGGQGVQQMMLSGASDREFLEE